MYLAEGVNILFHFRESLPYTWGTNTKESLGDPKIGPKYKLQPLQM